MVYIVYVKDGSGRRRGMAGPLRIEVAGVWYYVAARGNETTESPRSGVDGEISRSVGRWGVVEIVTRK